MKMKPMTEKLSREFWEVHTNKGGTIVIKCSENDIWNLWYSKEIVDYIPLTYYELSK